MRSLWFACAWCKVQKRSVVGVQLLALLLCLVGGLVNTRAAAAAGGSLYFTQPNYRGVIGGPPGARVVVEGSNWLAYSKVSLSVSSGGGCGGVPVGTFSTDQVGLFKAGFLWPLQANHPGLYSVCGTQDGFGSSVSTNTFRVLTSNPPSLGFTPNSVVAGGTLTVTGENWVPGPQTVNLLVVPCSVICDSQPVAQATVATKNDGTFSVQLTIAAGAVTGGYYIQASNATATLSATPTGPIQITGQATGSGTPIPGVSPTTTATRTTQDSPGSSSTPTSPISQAGSSIKNALLAAGLGLLALLGLVGGLAFFIGRTRGPDLSSRAKAGMAKESGPIPGQAETMRRATWRAPSPAGAGGPPPGRALAIQQRYQEPEAPLQEDMLTAPDDEVFDDQSSDDDYPWEERIPSPEPDLEEPPDPNWGAAAPPPRRYPRPGPLGDYRQR
jgi:hypothetical protein